MIVMIMIINKNIQMLMMIMSLLVVAGADGVVDGCGMSDGSTSGVVQIDSQTCIPYTVLDYTLATQSMRNEGGG
jgi:hypothetical protein